MTMEVQNTLQIPIVVRMYFTFPLTVPLSLRRNQVTLLYPFYARGN